MTTGSIDLKSNRGVNFAAGDMFYLLGADGLDYHITTTSMFSNIPVSVTVEDTVTIDVTDAEAFLVRKNADGGDVLVVDTNTPAVTIGGGVATKLVLSDTTSLIGAIYKGADPFLHNFHHPTGGGALPVGRNLFVGVGTGNFTMGSTATSIWLSSYNVAIGDDSFQANTTGFFNTAGGYAALKLNTVGANNTAFGANALDANTTGSANCAFGSNACGTNTTASNNLGIGTDTLANLTDGYENSATGMDALRDTTSGYKNSAFGFEASFDNTTGFQNSSLGHKAGRYLANGTSPNETTNTSLYLGASTKASADGVANEVVMGFDAIGAGSNTVTLGNASITATHLRGNIMLAGGLTTVGAVVNLGTNEPTVVANDVLGRINFYAPLEADGGDAILPGASIVALAENTFSATVNATSLAFQTGASETAITRVTITSTGNLLINTPTVAGNLAAGMALKNGTAGSASMADSVQLWAADAGGLAGHSGLHMRGEDDAANLVVVGYKEESANAETPQAAATPGTVCKFTDSGDATGNGTYQLALDGTTWNKLA